jgi:hypothetical protein
MGCTIFRNVDEEKVNKTENILIFVQFGSSKKRFKNDTNVFMMVEAAWAGICGCFRNSLK